VRRLAALVAVSLAALLVAAPIADAHRLTKREAKRAVKRFARQDFYPARIYVRYCTRSSAHRMRCRITAFYDSDYCIARYRVRLRGDTIYVSRPYGVWC
jgi:hypothetical protein